MARRLLSKPILAKEERNNGPPSANQGFSTAKPMLAWPWPESRPPPPIPPFLLMQNLNLSPEHITS